MLTQGKHSNVQGGAYSSIRAVNYCPEFTTLPVLWCENSKTQMDININPSTVFKGNNNLVIIRHFINIRLVLLWKKRETL